MMYFLEDIPSVNFKRGKDKKPRKKKTQYGFHPFSDEAKKYRKENGGKLIRATVLPAVGWLAGGHIAHRQTKNFLKSKKLNPLLVATGALGAGFIGGEIGLNTTKYLNRKTINRPGYYDTSKKKKN